MTKYRLKVMKNASIRLVLLFSILMIVACQSTDIDRNKSPNQVLNHFDKANHQMPDVLTVKHQAEFIQSINTELTSLAVLPAILRNNSEKIFVIPVKNSGDFAPAILDEYVLAIIKELNQWAYVNRLEIHGHTDSEGSELSNMLLSIRRANRVAERFEELGVEAGLLFIEAHGETQAIADNTTLDGRVVNRRIEVIVIGDIDDDVRGSLRRASVEGLSFHKSNQIDTRMARSGNLQNNRLGGKQ